MTGPGDLVTVDREGQAVLAVHVQPSARRPAVVGRHGDALKVRVAAPPEAGRANRAVQDLLADALGVPANTVELVTGASSRRKRFRIVGLSAQEARRRVAELVDGAPGG